MDVPLTSLEVLVLDCQTTGATPERGHLLEIAWARIGPDRPRPSVQASLVQLPEGARIPPRITALTGIAEGDLDEAIPPEAVWTRLAAEARDLGTRPAIAVAHFARFERAFLEALHREHGDARPFPLELLCTHEIACRVLPGLPRRGLKALAGHLGHVLGETKRAGAHVHASLLVWQELVARLEAQEGVTTLGELRTWMDETTPARRAGRDFAVSREARLDLPDAPGVYRMLGRGGEVLYLGKATSLKRRVNGYFQKRRHGRRNTLEMLTQVFSVDVQETSTPLEAALLESDEIKRLAPPYNLQLRERDPDVYFASGDLTSSSSRPDARHDLGPLPTPDALDGFAAVGEALRARPGAVPDALWLRALDLDEEAPLDPGCMTEGLTALREASGLREDASFGALLGLGARSWRAWMEARAAEPDDEEEIEDESRSEDEDEEGPRLPWAPRTSDEAQAALEGVVRRGAHLIRRCRWLQRLGESSLIWRPRASDGPLRVLVFEKGRVVRALDAEGDAAPPAPPGWPRAASRRRASFDAATYDRLRVFTTELRRLVTAEYAPRLCLSPRVTLEGAALARRLYWV